MKRIAISGLVIVLSSSTVLAAVLDGRWGLTPAGCDGRNTTEAMTIDTANRTIGYYESRCDLNEIVEIGALGLAWQATLVCSGEGETWTVKSVLGVFQPFDGTVDRLAMINVTDDFTTIYSRCQ